MTATTFPSARERRLAMLVLEPRTFMSDTREEARRINSVFGLIELLRACSPLEEVVEIGSFRGVSTETLLLFAQRMYAVDPWEGMESIHQQFLARTAPYPHLAVLRGRSTDVVDEIADRSLDLVYIDGAHDYASVRADLEAWRSKVKPGKWIAGHDYSDVIEGGAVIRAVDEMFGSPHRVFADSSWLVQIGE